MAWLVAAIVVPWVSCYFAVRLLEPAGRRSRLFSASLSLALALGLTSCTFFVGLVVFSSALPALLATEVAFFGLAGVPLFLAVRRRERKETRSPVEDPPDSTPTLTVFFIIILALAMVSFLFESFTHPHGGKDTYGMWNLKARFIIRGGEEWSSYFTPHNPHFANPDYPMLIPVTVGRLWIYLGEETIYVPMLVGGLFTFGVVGLLISSLALIRGRTLALLAGMVLLGMSKFLKFGCIQQADMPLGFFVLAFLVLVTLKDTRKGREAPCMLLAGAMAGFAAWTKNEGMLIMLAFVIARLFVVAPRSGIKTYIREMAFFAGGAFLVLAVLVWFNTQFAPTSVLITSQDTQTTTEKLTDISRYVMVVKGFLASFYRMIRYWVFLLPLYLLILGWSFAPTTRSPLRTLLWMGLIMFCGYLMVYVTSPYDLEYHTRTSQDRLLLQFIPALVFIFFLYAPAPDGLKVIPASESGRRSP